MLNLKNLIITPLLLAIFCMLSLQLYAQDRSDLEKKKAQAQKQIQLTNKLINETREGREKTFSNLQLLSKQIESRKEVIQNIAAEKQEIEQRINDNEENIASLEKDLKDLKEQYARLVIYAYKTKDATNRLLFVISADDFNQAYKRLAYLKEIAEYRRKQAEVIRETQEDIELQNEKLQKARAEKLALLNEFESEEEKLKREKQEQNSIFESLKGKEAELKQKLQAQKERADKLQKEIEKLIAAEAKRNAGSGYTLTPEEELISTNFGNNKGRLPWPVVSGVITSKFGKHAHPIIKGVQVNNNGVDIATTKGSAIRSIFDGEVRKVFKVPGYQNAVIIRHGSYLTTYTHLSSVYVSEGDKVSAKQNIGTVHTDTEENETILHFEIWYGQKKLNPEQWLAK
ncbi:MAG: murein hydrolase activator EnvC family protein [Bacteroidales bacterium]